MKVLVATDGSDLAMKAVHRALDMAQVRGAEVTIMTVAYSVRNYIGETPPDIQKKLQEKLEEEARATLKKALDLFTEKNIKVKTVVVRGQKPANNIINFAREGKFDRLIIGGTVSHGLQTAVMGSTAAKVASHAPCEVVVVR